MGYDAAPATPVGEPSAPVSGPEADPAAGTLFDRHVMVTDATALSPVILLAPHAGCLVPDEHRAAFTIDDAELAAERDAVTDHLTDALVSSVSGVSSVVNSLSRFVVDVERFDDEGEEMNAVGMGVLYTHGSHGQRIREVTDAERVVLSGFHADYSRAVGRLAQAAIARHGRAVIVDVHSYPRHTLPYERHAELRRPELCLGIDAFHAPDSLVAAVREAFGDMEIRINEPFQGAYVPVAHYRRDSRLQSVMLELRRDCYLDEPTLTPMPECFGAIERYLQALADSLR